MSGELIEGVGEFLLKNLKGKVFHYTSIGGYIGICASGYIDSNKSKVEDKYTVKSFSSRSSLTSVFDLREHAKDQLKYLYAGAGVYNRDRFGIVLCLEQSAIIPVLNTYLDMKHVIEKLGNLQHIPYVESYLSKPIPIESISDTYLFDYESHNLKRIDSAYNFISELEENERYQR